ncbi:MAG TPA: homoserine O-succinyltransferase [Stellaceae bacterium]|nr:homoserine O-succinyltransferase [Stellaceae bacterium]
MSLFALAPLSRAASRTPGGLKIGLVNNMPDAALKTTERQWRELLARAAGDARYTLRVFSFPDLPRSAEGQRHVAEHHEPIDRLWDGEFDGLIVTGAAPAAARLEDEPCWPTLTRLVEWAERHTRSTIWSCLAAHAAVRHLDGIARSPLVAKLSGVFPSEKRANHRLLALVPPRWAAPHSRYNELPEPALRARGYRILSRSSVAGADIFIKRCGSLFVFLQGHLEYDAGALGREYRRDVVNYVAGKSDRYPELPANYFAGEVAREMLAFRAVAQRERGDALFERFPALPPMQAPWHQAATGLFAGWLAQLDTRRSRRFGWLPLPVAAPRPAAPTYA